jgi:hypothetical protein
MQQLDARRILGLSEDADATAARAAYRGRLLHTHPDLSGAADATQRTVELTRAYHLVLELLEGAGVPDAADKSRSTGAEGSNRVPQDPPRDVSPEVLRESVAVSLLDDDTIGVGAPPAETLMILLDVAHQLGEISYLDASAGLVEVVVEFLDAPTSSVLLSLQGRATGMTEVFCSVEPLSGGDAPPTEAVTRLLLHTLVELVADSGTDGTSGGHPTARR